MSGSGKILSVNSGWLIHGVMLELWSWLAGGALVTIEPEISLKEFAVGGCIPAARFVGGRGRIGSSRYKQTSYATYSRQKTEYMLDILSLFPGAGRES